MVSSDLVGDFESYTRTLPTEKVYLHLNKQKFTTQEPVWFKAYILDGTYHTPNNLSGTLYVDLINSDRSRIVSSAMLKIDNGIAIGDFYLPDTLSTASYELRAYTNWMRNFDPEYFYSSRISIYNINDVDPELQSISKSDIPRTERPIIRFFPEGGSDIVAGLVNVVAYEVADANSKPTS